MSEPSVVSHFTPNGWRTVTPRIVVRDAPEPTDVPYGERRGMVQDKWGNTWQIATWQASGE